MIGSVNMSSSFGRPPAASARFSGPFVPNVAAKPTATMIEGSTNGTSVSDRTVLWPGNS